MHPAALAIVAAAALTACVSNPQKEEEPSKDTFECALKGERYLIRFVDAEARMLIPDGSRVILYQIPAASGVRYTNGLIELRGKGMQLQLIEDGFARTLEGCKPIMVPKEQPSLFDTVLPERKPLQ